MCFSFKASLITGLVSWIIGLYLLLSNKARYDDKCDNVIFLMIFSSIQFADTILWYNKLEKNNINYYTTSFLIPFILSLQLLYTFYIIQNNKNFVKAIFIWLYVLYLFYRFNGYSSKSDNCKKKLCSPVWGSKELHIIELFIFCALLLDTYYFGTLYGFSMIILVYNIFNYSYGSMWCAISNIAAFYYLYKRY